MTERANSALPGELRRWYEHLCACEAGGQTMVAYAKAHGLSVQAFYQAKARLVRYGAGQRPPSRPVFQRVEVVRRLLGSRAVACTSETGWSSSLGWRKGR